MIITDDSLLPKDGPEGKQGKQGPPGIAGRDAPPAKDGRDGVGFRHRGTYNRRTAYSVNDVVSDGDGSTFLCVQEHTGRSLTQYSILVCARQQG